MREAQILLDSPFHRVLSLRMEDKKPDPTPGQQTADQQAADAFAALAVKVVMKENAELPVLSVMADRKVRPIAR